jgi:hypothetical protein
MSIQSGPQAVLQIYIILTSFPTFSTYLSFSASSSLPHFSVSELTLLIVSIALSIINLGSGLIMLNKMELKEKLLNSLVSSLEFTYKVTTAALLFAMIKQYACAVYAFGLITRIVLLHVLNAMSGFESKFLENAGIAIFSMLLESMFVFGKDCEWKDLLLPIPTNVMSLLEALLAVLLLYYLPSSAADQLGDYRVKYILVIIIAAPYVLSKLYFIFRIYQMRRGDNLNKSDALTTVATHSLGSLCSDLQFLA